MLAATILFIATNAGIIGVVAARSTRWASTASCPTGCASCTRSSARPASAIIVFGAIACVTMIPGQADFLGNMYAFGAMLSFTIAHLAVIRLRLKHPDAERPYRGPGNVTRRAGATMPLFAVFGGLGTGHRLRGRSPCCTSTSLIAGVGWLTLGMRRSTPIYRRRQGLDLTDDDEGRRSSSRWSSTRSEYESVLVAFDGRDLLARAPMATAVKLAARRRRGIHVLVTDHRAATRRRSTPTLPEQEQARARRSSSRPGCRAAGA